MFPSQAVIRLNDYSKCLSELSFSKAQISGGLDDSQIKQKIQNLRIGVIGFGAMNGALVEGFLNKKMTSVDNLCILEVSKERAEVASKLGISKVFRNVNREAIKEMATFSDIILVGVKPQDFNKTLTELSSEIGSKHLVISIAAGISITSMEKVLSKEVRIVRVMPNTPCLVGCGASGFALGKTAKSEDSKIVECLMSSVGIAFEVSEKNLDAVTGVSGSGPAYVYLMIEAMADGGVKAGLPRNIALSLAAKVMEGASKMVMPKLGTLNHPGVLKDNVTSPAGTTIEALSVLERRGIRSTLIDAVVAASKRSEQLGKM